MNKLIINLFFLSNDICNLCAVLSAQANKNQLNLFRAGWFAICRLDQFFPFHYFSILTSYELQTHTLSFSCSDIYYCNLWPS